MFHRYHRITKSDLVWDRIRIVFWAFMITAMIVGWIISLFSNEYYDKSIMFLLIPFGYFAWVSWVGYSFDKDELLKQQKRREEFNKQWENGEFNANNYNR